MDQKLLDTPCISTRDLDEIESQLIDSVPYYVPRLVAEIRRLREQLQQQRRLPLRQEN